MSWEDLLEEEMASFSNILAKGQEYRRGGKWVEEPGGLQSMGSQRGGYD